MMEAPDPDEVQTAEQLRAALVQLPGLHPKIRGVATRTGLSASSVSELFAGKRRVTRRSLVAIVDAYAPADRSRWLNAWWRVTTGSASATGPSVPRELPADVPVFVGRESELAVLDQLMAGPSPTSVPRLLAIVGTAGVGKTALAVHWGHLRQDGFPDGSLYVDLRGYDPADPLKPSAALSALLRSLGVQDADQPADVSERAVRYRSLLAERRVLVVLDNARDSEHVRLLLPGASPGVTLITARDGLGSLRDRHGARRLELEVLSQQASSRLLRELVGDQASEEAAAIEAVVRYCAGLPLALRIAAGLAADRQGGLGAVADDLADDQGRLDLLDAGDPRSAVRSVLSWSFDILEREVSRTFRLLGTSPLPDADVYITAVLAGVPVAEARRHVTALLRARLVHERRPGRTGMHDLLRDYARDQANVMTDTEGVAAMARLRSYYLQGVHRAAGQIGLGSGESPSEAGALELPSIDRPDLAIAWFDIERPGLLAMVPIAIGQRDWTWICQVADAAWRLLLARGFHAASIRLHEVACRAARELGRIDWEARALEHLGIAEQLVGRFEDALEHLKDAVEGSRRAGDRLAEARSLGSLGTVFARRGEHEQAIHWLERGLEVADSIDAELVQARAHNNIGLVYQRWGRYDQALGPLDRAVDMARQQDETQLLATALNNRSLVLRRLGCGDQARADILEARRLSEEIGDRSLLRQVLDSLGSLMLEKGDARAALQPLHRALAMHKKSGDRAAEAESLDNLGVALRRLGSTRDAIARHDEAFDIAEAIGDRSRAASALLGSGDAHLRLGHWEAAARQITSALEVARQLNNAEQQARAMELLRCLPPDQGQVVGGEQPRQ